MLASMPGSSPMRPQEPIKRRRGRPPKNNKLPEAFPTLTLQFQTSPESGSPTAESNSNMMVKMGEPDTFTPLMKVSPSNPSSRKRRRKSNYHSDIDDSPSKRSVLSQNTDLGSEEPLLTPMSLSSVNGGPSLYVNAKTLENLSFITKGDSKHESASTYSLATPPKHNAFDRNGSSLAKLTESTIESSSNTGTENEKVKLAPTIESLADSMSYVDDDSFLFQLVVDERGKAVLSNKGLSKSNPKVFHRDTNDHLSEFPHEMTRPSILTHSNTAIGIETFHRITKDGSSNDKPKRKLSEPTKPVLPSYASLVSSSDNDALPEKLIVPQTPQSNTLAFSETPIFMQTDTSAPQGDLAFNLTPQFNAMMYLMMSINSPQQKRNFSQQQPFLNPQIDLNQYNRLNGGQAHAIDTRELLGAQDSTPNSASSDEGDARAALRKAFNRGK